MSFLCRSKFGFRAARRRARDGILRNLLPGLVCLRLILDWLFATWGQ